MEYLDIIKNLERKLIEAKKELKKEKISAAEENKSLFNAKWKVYKQISPMVKKVLIPLVKALRQMYKVKFKIFLQAYKNSDYLNVEWEIKIGMIHFTVTLPDSQDCLEIERKRYISYSDYKDHFKRKAKLTEESLLSLLKIGFLDYINLKMV